jgi:hypothetical protein
VNDDELERLVRPEHPRGYRALLAGSIVSGVACFVVTVLISQLLVPADASSSVEITPLMLALLALFAVLLAACIALGYAAARRKPPSD